MKLRYHGLLALGVCCLALSAPAMPADAGTGSSGSSTVAPGSKAAPNAVALRQADIEVALTLALELLQQERPADAVGLLSRVLEADTSGRALYLHGIACARLGDWACAVDRLEAAAVHRNAGRFPRLPLELGIALLQVGRLQDARGRLEAASALEETRADAERWLEALDGGPEDRPIDVRMRRRTGAFAALGAGFDSNAPGTPDSGWLDCPSGTLGSQQVSSSCGGFTTLSLGAWHQLGRRRPARIDYRFDLRWYPDPELAALQLHDHQARATVRVLPKLELAGTAEAAALALDYAPLYRASAGAGAGYLLLERGSVRAVLGATAFYTRYGDLRVLWDSGGSGLCAPGLEGDADLLCTSRRTGPGARAELAVRWQTGPIRWLEQARIELRAAEVDLYRGIEAWNRLQARIELPLELSLGASVQVSQEWDTAWSVRGIQPALALSRAWGPHVEVRAAWAWSGVRAYTRGSELEENRYRRQVGGLEVLYVF